ncbi:MAG: STAS domain-containing protein [Bacteroidales bacterium]|nr:STAS domain-containing protein [Bacteroidales bacterium]
MEVIINNEAHGCEAKLIGRLDTAASQEVSDALQPLMDKAGGTLVLDCHEMTYIASSGLRIFLNLRKAAALKGGKVIVRGINSDIRNVFMMTGFLNLFQIED